MNYQTLEHIHQRLRQRAVSIQDRPDLLPGHTWLYKGKSLSQTTNDFLFDPDSSFRFEPLLTLRGGDFNRSFSALYFAESLNLSKGRVERCW